MELFQALAIKKKKISDSQFSFSGSYQLPLLSRVWNLQSHIAKEEQTTASSPPIAKWKQCLLLVMSTVISRTESGQHIQLQHNSWQ